jgi:hypothetical protein
MIYQILKRVYINYILNIKFFQKFLLKSYHKINLNKDLRSDYSSYLDTRYHEKDIFTSIQNNIINSKIDKKNYKQLYILTNLNLIKDNKNGKNSLTKIISNTADLKEDQIKKSFFFIVFTSDDLALPHLKRIIENQGAFKSLDIEINQSNSDFSNATSYRFVNKNCMNAIKNTFNQKNKISGSYLSTLNTHENICEAIELTKKVEGDYVEIGVFEGGSALTALSYLKQVNLRRKVYLLDTFEGFNYEDSENSPDIKWHGSHFIDKADKTKKLLVENLKDFDNYQLITSNICKDDLPEEIKKISLAHIDVDLYEATLQSLKKVSKKLSKNGIIMCEDPVYTPLLYGALYAMEEFLKSNEGKGFIKIFKKNHYFLLKQD